MSFAALSIIEYLLVAAAICLVRLGGVPFIGLLFPIWAVCVPMVLILALSLAKGKLVAPKSTKAKQSALWIDILVLSVASVFFTSILHRAVAVGFLSYVLEHTYGHPLENDAADNNEFSYTLISAYSCVTMGLCSLYRCVFPAGSSRLFNILFVIALLALGRSLGGDVIGVRHYDEFFRERMEQLRQQQKEKEALRLRLQKEKQERINRYHGSPFYLATHIDYDTMMADKGMYGEYVASTYLSDIKTKYHALFSVYVPIMQEPYSTEVDCIVISLAGIDALEIKNRSVKWTISDQEDMAQVEDQYGKIHESKSPMVQNRNHIRAIKNFFEHHKDPNVRKAFQSLQCSGYLVFGPDTLGWTVHSQSQGYCGYKSIGSLINERIKRRNAALYAGKDKEYIANSLREPMIAMEYLYQALKPYQNNEKLRTQHDAYVRAKFTEDEFNF